jgi:hypothetical protein
MEALPDDLPVAVFMLICSSESELLCNWRFIADQFVLATSPLRPKIIILIFQLNTCGIGRYVAPLWREDGSVVYCCCWSSPAQSFSGPIPAGLMTTFYCVTFETPPTWRARSPYLYPPGTGWPGYTSSHWDPFSSPPTTRRATVEVFESVSTRDSFAREQILLIYNDSVPTL